MKLCIKCNTTKQFIDYHKCSKAKDGLQSLCKVCNNASRVAYYKTHKKQEAAYDAQRELTLVNKMIEYLKTHPCIDCGESDPIVLEFDHVRGKKIKPVTTMVYNGYSWKNILEEIKKCDIRCANCHRRKTARDFNWRKSL